MDPYKLSLASANFEFVEGEFIWEVQMFSRSNSPMTADSAIVKFVEMLEDEGDEDHSWIAFIKSKDFWKLQLKHTDALRLIRIVEMKRRNGTLKVAPLPDRQLVL